MNAFIVHTEMVGSDTLEKTAFLQLAICKHFHFGFLSVFFSSSHLGTKYTCRAFVRNIVVSLLCGADDVDMCSLCFDWR